MVASNNDTGKPALVFPLLRIWLCGPFQMEWVDPITGAALLTSDVSTGGRDWAAAIALLALLLCQPNRQAHRDWIMEQFWPEGTRSVAVHRLENIFSCLRKLLRPPSGGESLVRSTVGKKNSGTSYCLEAYPKLWVDIDALVWQVEQAARMERFGDDALPFWQHAFALIKRGPFLVDEPYQPYAAWVAEQRERLQGYHRQCVHALSRIYLARDGDAGKAEALLLLRTYWQQNKTDEDALRPLLELLGEQERYQEAETYYQQLLTALADLGPDEKGQPRVPDARTCDIREYLYTRNIQRQAKRHVSVSLGTEPTRLIEQQVRSEIPLQNIQIRSEQSDSRCTIVDWGEAPSADQFYGREQELTELLSCIQAQRCRIVALCGMGGIGKTSLAVVVVNHIKDSFEVIFWRSLQHAPSLRSLLQNCLKFFAGQQHRELPEETNEQISFLLAHLRAHRCLIVLDNVETVLQDGTSAGPYRAGYEEYGTFLRRIGEAQHQSCLLLTSREKPPEVAHLEGSMSRVRSWQLAGIGLQEGQEMLKDRGLFGSDEQWARLIRLYAGKPLALKLISEPIRELFRGDIATFLKKESAIIGDIYDLLDQQFHRLSQQERDILYWLAIEREAVSQEMLWEESISFLSKKAFFDALTSLRRRSMIETNDAGWFTLQPVIMEYVTSELIKQVCEEIDKETVHLLASHALSKAQSKEYIRKTQVRLIITSIVEQLQVGVGRSKLEKKFQVILARLREAPSQQVPYAAGNILNLLVSMNCDLRGYDFSALPIRQAFLQGAHLPGVNFAYADLATSVFTDTFGSILSLAFSPDGTSLAASTSNNEIRLWHINGTLVQTFQGHTSWVRSVMFHPDARTIVSSSNDQTVRVWETSTAQCIHLLQGHVNRVWSASFSPNGTFIASGGDDLSIHLWETSTGRCLRILCGHTNRVNSVVFSPDGRFLVSGSEDQTVRLWETQSGHCLKILEGHTGWIRTVTVSPDGSILASGGSDQTIRLWDVRSGQCLKTLQGHTGWIYSVAFSPHGNLLASGSGDQTIRLWDVRSGQCLKTLQGHTGWARSVAFSPNGNLLASGSEDQTIRLWDVRTGQCLKLLQGYNRLINTLAVRGDGNILASGGDDLCLWEIRSGRCIKVFQGHSSWVYAVAFHPDGKTFASSGSDHTVRLWELHSGRCFRILQGHTKCVWSIAFHPDGKALASASNDLSVRIWAVENGQCLRILRGHTGWIYSVAFSPDGNLLASASDDQTIRLWEASTGECLQVLHGHSNRVWSVVFSPDGHLLVSGSEDQTIRIWAVESGQCQRTLRGHTGQIRSLACSPDGKMVASGSEDQTIRLWDVSSGHCLKTLQGHQSPVKSVAFSQSENAVFSGGDDGTIRLWNTQTGDMRKTLISAKPYEGMNITAIVGVTPAQKAALIELGAHEDQSNGDTQLIDERGM